MKACRACGSSISQSAVLCAKCHSYQDWRYNIGVGQFTLALLTALFSVIGLVVPIIVDVITVKRSDLTGSFVDFRKGRAVFLVQNAGNAPGVIIDGLIVLDQGDGPNATKVTTGFSLTLEADDQTIIPATSAKTVALTGDGVNPKLIAAAYGVRSSDDCTLKLNGRQFDGSPFAVETRSLCVGMINTILYEDAQQIYDMAKSPPK
jgi:hypothetical protein